MVRGVPETTMWDVWDELILGVTQISNTCGIDTLLVDELQRHFGPRTDLEVCINTGMYIYIGSGVYKRHITGFDTYWALPTRVGVYGRKQSGIC